MVAETKTAIPDGGTHRRNSEGRSPAVGDGGGPQAVCDDGGRGSGGRAGWLVFQAGRAVLDWPGRRGHLRRGTHAEGSGAGGAGLPGGRRAGRTGIVSETGLGGLPAPAVRAGGLRLLRVQGLFGSHPEPFLDALCGMACLPAAGAAHLWRARACRPDAGLHGLHPRRDRADPAGPDQGGGRAGGPGPHPGGPAARRGRVAPRPPGQPLPPAPATARPLLPLSNKASTDS